MNRKLTLAPDWLPNTNHTGFIVAQSLGFYDAVGLELELLPYADQPTAAKRVLSNHAQVGLGPQETVIAYADSAPLLALAAINAHNPSALAVLAESPITRPRELDGTRYASYGARFELHVVREMVRADGGQGAVEERVLPKPTVPAALYTGEAESTWIFPAWEGVEAALQGRPLRSFLLRDYGIPDLYTPVLFAEKSFAQAEPELLTKFVGATARGFELAAAEPARAAELLLRAYPELDAELVRRSQALASPNYQGNGKPWGVIDNATWATYGRYLQTHGFITTRNGETAPESQWDEMHTAEFL